MTYVLAVDDDPILTYQTRDTSLAVAVDMISNLCSTGWQLDNLDTTDETESLATLISPDGAYVTLTLKQRVVVEATCPVCKERRRVVTTDDDETVTCIVCKTRGNYREFGLDG